MISSEYMQEAKNLTAEQNVEVWDVYLDAPGNSVLRDLLLNEINEVANNPKITHGEILHKALQWNPNNLVTGPKETFRPNDPKNSIDDELLKFSPYDQNVVYQRNLKILEKLAALDPKAKGTAHWHRNPENKLFYYDEDRNKLGVHLDSRASDTRKIKLSGGNLIESSLKGDDEATARVQPENKSA